MRTIHRTIVSAFIFSRDGKLLMGKKDPQKGGVYSDCWHIPGGGVDEGETFEQTLKREVQEEVGIDISTCRIVPLPNKRSGTAEKTLKDSGEKVLSEMEFNYFEIHIDKQAADEITTSPSDDLIELQWFAPEELGEVKQIPGGKEFYESLGYIPVKN